MLRANSRASSSCELFAMRPWLAIDEAAEYLTGKAGYQISHADVLRLGLDGLLPLAVNIPEGMKGNVFRVDDLRHIAVLVEPIGGVWDLILTDAGRRQVEHEYHFQAGLPFISMEGCKGAVIARDSLRCELSPDRGESGFSPRPASALLNGALLVVRRTELDAFAAQLPPKPAAPSSAFNEKSLGTRERTTLLTIIAALAQAAGIDVSQPSKAGAVIEAETQKLGARVAARTIENHIKEIPEALERHQK